MDVAELEIDFLVGKLGKARASTWCRSCDAHDQDSPPVTDGRKSTLIVDRPAAPSDHMPGLGKSPPTGGTSSGGSGSGTTSGSGPSGWTSGSSGWRSGPLGQGSSFSRRGSGGRISA